MKCHGLDKLTRKLAALEKRDARAAMRKATRAGTTVLLRAVRSEVPVDEGLLKKAQTSKVFGRGNNAGGIVGADVAKLQEDAKSDESRPTNIDHLVEFGHVTPEGQLVPPSGYMRRAAASAMPVAEQRFAAKLAEEIEKAAQGG